jgi:outer membrane protein OmpA-like peptidoglycan-associated protein
MPPKELSEARSMYAIASTSPANQLAPADLHTAKVALDQAENAFQNDPNSQAAIDLAYVADRKTQTAMVRSQQAQDNADKKKADQAYQEQQARLQRATQAELDAAKQQVVKGNLAQAQGAILLNDERNARKNAEDKTLTAEQATATAEQKTAASEAKNKELQASLVKLAAFKEESRGLVLTLSGSVLFVSNQSTLLPSAKTKLDQIAAALASSGSRKILVEGHSDSQGNRKRNLKLSEQRANAVRSYLVSRSFPAAQIRAEGLGESRPVASNKNAEGRANNRRVELVILPM